MLTELQNRKFTRLFNVYDANRDGYLERSDYERIAVGIADFLGLASDSAERQQHTTKYMANWEHIKMMVDQDNDDRVTQAEFMAFIAYLTQNPEIFTVLALATTQDTMNHQDRDQDGRIARAEYLGVTQCYAMPLAEAEEAFQHLDRDNDGFISQEELLKDVEEFFTSNDPDAPGNWLVGRY